MPTCIEWGEERHEECDESEDQGYNECSESEDQGYNDCCDWWPCSWGCDALVWVSNVVCVGWTWISHVVCVGWTWITTAICVLWDIIVTAINILLVTLESLLGWVLSALAFIVELLEAIPFIGAIIRWILNFVSLVQVMGASLVDAFLGLIGIRPEKLLRLCTIILSDEEGVAVASTDNVVQMLQLAADVYKRDANVRIIPSGPFRYTTGFLGAETVDASWVQIDGANGDNDTLNPSCDESMELFLTGSQYQLKSSTLCFFGSWRRVLGYGAPVTCFIVRDAGNDSGTAQQVFGCSAVIPDYIVTEDGIVTPLPSPRSLGHEVGHSCLLWHACVDDDITNLMASGDGCDPTSTTNPDRFNPRMDDWQALIVRASKHATYF